MLSVSDRVQADGKFLERRKRLARREIEMAASLGMTFSWPLGV